MGFIKAFAGALGGTFADQWKDYYGPKQGVSETVALTKAVPYGTNANRGENTKGSENIITNGSKIMVPEGMALITLQDGAVTGFIAEPGGFIFSSDDPNSKSMFSGDGILASTIGQSWERFKFGGMPGSQQTAFYVNLKEIPNNKFGTSNIVYWDDAYFGTQVGAIMRGTYTLKIVDPLLFVKNFVPMTYLQSEGPDFDFADMDSDAGNQLYTEVVSTLSAAFAKYTNDPDKGNRMSKIQSDQLGLAQAMSQAVEEAYGWKNGRGLEIVKTAILSIEYDEDTKALMKDVQKADALSGARGNAFMQQSVARGIEAAGNNGGGSAMAFMGMGMNASGGMMSSLQQPVTPSSYQAFNQPQPAPAAPVQPQVASTPAAQAQPAPEVLNEASPAAPSGEDATAKLLEMKKLLDAGAISQEDYDKVKNKLLGI